MQTTVRIRSAIVRRRHHGVAIFRGRWLFANGHRNFGLKSAIFVDVDAALRALKPLPHHAHHHPAAHVTPRRGVVRLDSEHMRGRLRGRRHRTKLKVQQHFGGHRCCCCCCGRRRRRKRRRRRRRCMVGHGHARKDVPSQNGSSWQVEQRCQGQPALSQHGRGDQAFVAHLHSQ